MQCIDERCHRLPSHSEPLGQVEDDIGAYLTADHHLTHNAIVGRPQVSEQDGRGLPGPGGRGEELPDREGAYVHASAGHAATLGGPDVLARRVQHLPPQGRVQPLPEDVGQQDVSE